MKKQIRDFVLLVVVVFLLNLIWEYFHFSLYYDLTGIPKHQHLWLATLTDALIIGAVFLFISLFHKSIEWIKKPRKADYSVIIFSCLIIAISIETHALLTGKWAYKEIMPTLFGIGISPLFQLATTSLVGLEIFRRIKKTKIKKVR